MTARLFDNNLLLLLERSLGRAQMGLAKLQIANDRLGVIHGCESLLRLGPDVCVASCDAILSFVRRGLIKESLSGFVRHGPDRWQRPAMIGYMVLC